MRTKILLTLMLAELVSAATIFAGTVITDGSVGTASTLSGPGYTIGSELGQIRGNNLFHSFSQFNLSKNDIATFSHAGPGAIANIISRVTGGSPSSINGMIRSSINGANMYLLNPSGIMFGPNASLDITGSFHASTADYLQFGADRFYSNPQLPLPVSISTPDPTAFGFLKAHPAAISVNGSLLTVPQGKSISLVSGGVSVSDANLWAYGGTVNLISVASEGEVAYNGVSMNPQGFSALGPVSVTETRPNLQQPRYSTAIMPGISVFMPGQRIANLDASGLGGGKIIIRGGSFYVSGATVYNDTYGNTAPGVIDVNVTGDVNIASSNITGNAMAGNASGAAIVMSGTNIRMTDGAYINTDSTFTSANGSTISLKASNSLTMEGLGTTVSSSAYGGGKAGDVLLEAPSIVIGNGSYVFSSAPILNGPQTTGAGTITVNAAQSLVIAGRLKSDTGQGSSGKIRIATKDLSISGTGMISTSLLQNLTTKPRTSGDIDITADKITMSGDGRIESRAFYSNSGSSGSITINTGSLTLLDRSAISASIDSVSGSGGHINVTATGDILVSSNPINLLKEKGSISSDSTAGDAGHIRMEATNITVNNGAKLSTVAQGGTGKGGDIILIAHGVLAVDGIGSSVQTDTLAGGAAGSIGLNGTRVLVRNGGLISSASLPGSTGAAGNIGIVATDLTVNSASITTQSAQSLGGSISITAPGIVNVTRGEITASVKGGYGNGGNVTINAGYLTLNDGLITAQAEWGNGGNLLINVDKLFIKSFDSLLSASSRYGQQGTVVVNAPNTDVAGALAAPKFDILNLNAFIPKRCMAADELNSSTFTLLGSDGLPAGPENSFPIL